MSLKAHINRFELHPFRSPLSTILTSKGRPFIISYVHSSVKQSESTYKSLHKSCYRYTHNTRVNRNANAPSDYCSWNITPVICKQYQCDLFPSHDSFLYAGSANRFSQNITYIATTIQACMCITLLLPNLPKLKIMYPSFVCKCHKECQT